MISRCQVQGGVVCPIDFIYVETLVANVVGPGGGVREYFLLRFEF